MAIYRVTGEDPETMISREIFVRAPSLERALEFAHAGVGLNKVSAETAHAEEALGHPIVSAADADSGVNADQRDLVSAIARSPLISSPIMTIAIGVFSGLLLWSVFGLLFAMAIGASLSLR